MLVPRSLTVTTQQRECARSDSASSDRTGSWLSRALQKLPGSCFFGRVSTVNDMQSNGTNSTSSIRLENIGVARKQAFFLERTEDRHRNHPLLNAIYDRDVQEVENLLQQGYRVDITPIWSYLAQNPSSLPKILDLLEKHNALPQGVNLPTLQLVLFCAGNMSVSGQCAIAPNVNIDGFSGVPSPIKLATRFLSSPKMVDILIRLGAQERPIGEALSGINPDELHLSGLFDEVDALKRINEIDEIYDKNKEKMLIAEKFFLNPNKDLLQFIDMRKIRPAHRESNYFGTFLCWAAKNNKHELFQQAVFRDVFSSFPRASYQAALVAGAYGRTEFLLTAFSHKLLTVEVAIRAVGEIAKMGNIVGVQEILKLYPEYVVGCKLNDRPKKCEKLEEVVNLYQSVPNAMFFALRNGHTSIVKLLLGAGAQNMSASFGLGNSLVQWAMFVKSPPIAKLVLRPGVDLDYKNFFNDTALDIAIEHKFYEGVRLLNAWQASKAE